MTTGKEGLERFNILYFKDAYTKEGIEITLDRLQELLKTRDLAEQIRDTMEEKDVGIKTIMKLTLPYFLLQDNTTELSKEDKMGFFTDDMIHGCCFDPNYDGYSCRVDNILEQHFRQMVQGLDRDEFSIEQLPNFRYPPHIKDPYDFTSKSNQRLNKKELLNFKKKTDRLRFRVADIDDKHYKGPLK